MKILLIYPYCLEARLHAEEVSVPPLGIYYVGAMLKEHPYDVEILNWHDMNQRPQEMRHILAEKKPDVIGCSILHANRWGGIEIARIAKATDPNVKIVFGGIGATFLWEHLLTHFREIDYIVLGEGERTFLNLINAIEAKDHDRIKDIRGIAFRQGDTVVKTDDAEAIHDLDNLPNPAQYFTYQHVAATRGCPGKCTFCGSPAFWGTRVRFHSPEYFVTQLELLYKKGGRFFYFSDDTFTIRKDRVIEICKKIIEKGLRITWAAISRVKYINAEILYWMRRAGCTQISYGVESGSKEIRNRVLNKNIKTHEIKQAFDLTTRYGILARAYFIYGSPGETWETINESIALMREIKPLGMISYILDIFPGTALYADFLQKTGATDDIWLKQIEDILYFETDPDLDPETILAFGRRLRSAFHTNLSGFADAIDLVPKEDLFALHADFLSRLGLTFSHGDYAAVDEIEGKDKIAEDLFIRSLQYGPDHRAYWGLGLIKQQGRDPEGAIRVLAQGIEHFPESEQLHLCMGINLMNLGKYDQALSCLLKFQHSPECLYYIVQCYEAVGDRENHAAFLRKFRALQKK